MLDFFYVLALAFFEESPFSIFEFYWLKHQLIIMLFVTIFKALFFTSNLEVLFFTNIIKLEMIKLL